MNRSRPKGPAEGFEADPACRSAGRNPRAGREFERNSFGFNNITPFSISREQANVAANHNSRCSGPPDRCISLGRIVHYSAKHGFAIDGATEKSENPITQSGWGDPERIEKLLKKARKQPKVVVSGGRREWQSQLFD